MLITKQPKKSNSNIRYSLGNHPALPTQFTGKAIKKNKLVKQQLHKNLSQLQYGFLNDSKQNNSLANLMMARPHSSLIASDISGSLSRSRQKMDLSSFCKDRIRLKKIDSKKGTLGIQDITHIKDRKASGKSHSNQKWNNRSVQDDPSVLKFMMAQNRKKYNLSCGDAIQNKSKNKQNPIKGKKKSIPNNVKNMTKGQSKKVIIRPVEPEVKKFRPSNLVNKSKGNTSVININAVALKAKKKQKQNKQNRRKHQQQRSKSKSKSKNKKSKKSSKSSKMFIFYKGDDQNKQVNDHQYPINKYVDMKKKVNKNLNIKVGVDYNFTGMNMISASSGALFNDQFSSSIERHPQQNLLPMFAEQQSDTINLQQIKEYQKNSPIKQSLFSLSLDKSRRYRKQIQAELQQQYPYLDSTQLQFLASVVFIQRKWRQCLIFRQFIKRKPVITEYLIDGFDVDENKSKDKSQNGKNQQKSIKKLRISNQDSRLDGGKNMMMSKTKVNQFDDQSNLKQTVSRSKIQVTDPHQYQTRKPTNHQIFALDDKQLGNKDANDNACEIQSNLTDRKPATENNRVVLNYAFITTREIFPQATYLEYRKNILREEFEKTMKHIMQNKNNKVINEKQFQMQKENILGIYQKEITELKKTKHDIKKGYLKYIECVNKVKQIKNEGDHHKVDNKYGLRKVSSDSNFLSTLYEKIFKFDKCISEWSGGSQSIEMLTKKILIRKQFFEKQNKKSERRSLSDLRSAARSSFELIRSSRDPEASAFLMFEQTDKLNIQNSDRQPQIYDRGSHEINQFKFSNELLKLPSKQERQVKDSETQILKLAQKYVIEGQEPLSNRLQIKTNKQAQQDSIALYTNSIPLINLGSSQHQLQELCEKVEQQIVLELTKQLQKEIHRINPALVDIILINQPQTSDLDIQFIDEEEQDQQKSPAMYSLQKELAHINSPTETERDDPNAMFETEPNKIIEYVIGFMNFVIKKGWTAEILHNVNHNQTFEALAYLRFLRDFEIPEDDYKPIINNEKFIEWESQYTDRKSREEDNEIRRQSETIFHRCVFEVFLSELEKNRPYGQRGRPFPWEQKYSFMTIRAVTEMQLSHIFEKCVNKIEEYLIYRCGLISEKLIIANQEELERAHQENQDRIIEMLEQDLFQSSHQWYQVEEHSLEMKLEVNFLMEELLIEELVFFLSRR